MCALSAVWVHVLAATDADDVVVIKDVCMVNDCGPSDVARICVCVRVCVYRRGNEEGIPNVDDTYRQCTVVPS